MTPANDSSALYEGMIRRVGRLIWILAAAGAAALIVTRGLSTGVAFLIGATVSYGSFTSWQRLVSALAPESKRRSPWFILRMIALATLACVIIKLLGLNVAAAVAGLLVSGAAMILELVYELIYART